MHVPSSHVPPGQRVPSSAFGFEQVPVLASHMPTVWHASLAVQVTGLAPLHSPAWHVSLCVHALPSSQLDPSGRFGLEQKPVVASQVPTAWHWSLAVQVTGSVPVHTPATQKSSCVQALPSSQVDPSGKLGSEQVPVVGSQVPTSWH